jgi:hypothetical protein
MTTKKKTDNCEWESDKPCLRSGTVDVASLSATWAFPITRKLCERHATEYANAYLEHSLSEPQKWAFERVIYDIARRAAEDVYHEQRREEEYDG